MAVTLRLRRLGRKKLPVYSVVATDSRNARDGRFIEDLGRYEPLQQPARVEFKQDRVLYWLAQGAQPSDTVRNLLSKQGMLLAHSLRMKGKSEEEVNEAILAHQARHAEKAGLDKTMTPAARRAAALEEERKRVEQEEAEAARQRAEEEARAKAEAEEARRKQAEERERAAAEARAAQEEANKAQAEQETPAAEAAAEAPAPAAPEGEGAANVQPEEETKEGEA